ncbi:hypothetical protein GCM10029964_028580 [Kibdelosporangium lantanae]
MLKRQPPTRFLVGHQMSNADLVVAMVQHIPWIGPREPAEGAEPGLGVPSFVPGDAPRTPTSWRCGPVRINETVDTDSRGQERHTFSRRERGGRGCPGPGRCA